jgi:signal peptidase II
MDEPRSTRGSLVYLWISVAVIGADQLVKAIVVKSLALYESVVILPVLSFSHLQNTGAAFSFLADAQGWPRWLFTGLALIVSAVLGAWLRRIDRNARVLACAVALILGGALGNAIDRLRLGFVVDFVQVHWGAHYFAAFNVADSAISIGAALLLLDSLLASQKDPARAREAR